MKNQKILVVATTVPPLENGPAVYLGKFLRRFPEGSFCIFTQQFHGKVDVQSKIKCPYYTVKPTLVNFNNSWKRRVSLVIEHLGILSIVLKGIKVARKEKISRIFLIFTNEGRLQIAAYFISRILHIPLFVYVIDLYEEGVYPRIQKIIARVFEKRILHSAKKVFVLNESMKSFYLTKHGLHCDILLPPVDCNYYSPSNSRVTERKKRNIVYTGNVWITQLDSIRRMCRVVDSMEDVEFHIYTAERSAEELKDKEICGKNVFVGFAKSVRIAAIQQNADILFLPLAFQSPFQQWLKVLIPGKTAEYLAAGSPILVHAPEDSFVAQYARESGFAVVITDPSEEALKKAVTDILENQQLRGQLVSRAKIAVQSHNIELISGKLQQALGIYKN